jgi:hypothetical protein
MEARREIQSKFLSQDIKGRSNLKDIVYVWKDSTELDFKEIG